MTLLCTTSHQLLRRFSKQLLLSTAVLCSTALTTEKIYAQAVTSQQDVKTTVKGKVLDETGIPLPGAIIQLKGSSVGTQTDINGEYKLSFNSKTAVLVFSYIGM